MTNPAGRSICLQDSLDNENIGRKLILAEVKFDLAYFKLRRAKWQTAFSRFDDGSV